MREGREGGRKKEGERKKEGDNDEIERESQRKKRFKSR